MDCIANQAESVQHDAEKDYFCVERQLVVILEICNGRVSLCYLFQLRNSGICVAKIPEFRDVQKTENSGIRKFGNWNG